MIAFRPRHFMIGPYAAIFLLGGGTAWLVVLFAAGLFRPRLLALLVGLSPLTIAAVYYLTTWWLLSDGASVDPRLYLDVQWLSILPVPVAAVGAGLAGSMIIARRAWSELRLVVLSAIAALSSAFAIMVTMEDVVAPIEERAWLRARDRAAPLLVAIDQFEADHGGPPPQLEALVPTYLTAVPATGIRVFPRFRYGPPAHESGLCDPTRSQLEPPKPLDWELAAMSPFCRGIRYMPKAGWIMDQRR